MWSFIAPEKLALSRHELQEVVSLLSKLITQIAFVLASKIDHILNSFGITKVYQRIFQFTASPALIGTTLFSPKFNVAGTSHGALCKSTVSVLRGKL
jgi:hypothetical protein